VTFTIRKWGVLTVTGRFRDVSGEVLLDRDRPEASRVTVEVRVASVSTGEAGRDQTLQSEDFFDTARHPAMTFVSSAVSLLPDGRASVTGDLTIRGVTRRITVPVTVHGPTVDTEAGTIAGFETVFPIDRRDYGVHGSRWSGGRAILGTQVRVRMLVSASARRPR
jgi:polyisoprenoid-binding protein YceI